MGLDRVAVRAQGDHLDRVIRAALGDISDVVDFQERFAVVADVLDVAGPASLPAQNTSALWHRRQYSAARSLKAISAGEADRPSSLSSAA